MSVYTFLYRAARCVMFLWHPVFRVEGRQHLQDGGQYIICPNHSGMADPIWVIYALQLHREPPCIMAKDSVMKVPVLSAFLRSFGVFGVKRGENDVQAVKHGLSVLKNGKSIMLFPEGTRMRPGKVVEPKSGAMLFSLRTQTPILPVYLQQKRFPFSPLRCVIGEPYLPSTERKLPPEELRRLTGELMEKIYALGETK